MRVWVRAVLAIVFLCLLYPMVALGFYFFSPDHNAELGQVDTLIVLGCPTKLDGSPTPEQRERVLESVREYRRGVSQHIIMTGGAAHNRFTEAHAMSMFAQANGVPASAVIEEDQARDTIQNIFYSEKIMARHSWHTAEVISSPYHLPRTALILRHYPQLRWETHAAQWPPEYGLLRRLELDWREAAGGLRIRTNGFRPSPFLPQ